MSAHAKTTTRSYWAALLALLLTMGATFGFASVANADEGGPPTAVASIGEIDCTYPDMPTVKITVTQGVVAYLVNGQPEDQTYDHDFELSLWQYAAGPTWTVKLYDGGYDGDVVATKTLGPCNSTPPDADGDGVQDSKDKCANTPKGEKVDANGCSESQKDDDNDGVTNDNDKCPGTPAGTKVDKNGCPKQDPPGNNGTVKIDDQPVDGVPNNQPHVGCTFRVDFYNFDKGVGNATVTFALQSPTADGRTLTVTSGDLTPNIGGDAAGGGTDLDASETYTLAFTGAPHPQQGYHVKLTVNAPGSQGNDVKHKVFWVSGCGDTTPEPENPVVTAKATSCVDKGDSNGTVNVTVKNPNDTDDVAVVNLNGVTAEKPVAAGGSVTLPIAGFAPGTYTGTATLKHAKTSAEFSVKVAECDTPPPPVCVDKLDASNVKANYTNAPYEAAVKYTGDKPICEKVSVTVSLNSYATDGPTWETSGTQVFVDHDQFTVDADHTSGTLKVKPASCYYQTDLYWGSTRYDGVDGALPHYPESPTPDHLIDWRNGGKKCEVPPPTPAQPTVKATSDACVTQGGSSGVANVEVTNTTDDTKATVTYEVTLNGATKQVVVEDGKSGSVQFTGLAPGDYPVSVKGSDDTTASTTVTVKKCEEPPTPVINPQGTISVDCKGDGVAKLDNSKSTTQFGFEVVVNGKATLYSLKAGETKDVSFSGAKPGSKVVLQDGEANELDSATVPEKCATPPPPVKDVCPNIKGAQSQVPNGYVLKDGKCVKPPTKHNPPSYTPPGNQPPSTGGDGLSELPNTGVSNVVGLGLLGVALLIGGGALLRRRRENGAGA